MATPDFDSRLWQFDQLFRRTLDLGLANFVFEAHDRVGVADVEVSLIADFLNCHAEGAIQAGGKEVNLLHRPRQVKCPLIMTKRLHIVTTGPQQSKVEQSLPFFLVT